MGYIALYDDSEAISQLNVELEDYFLLEPERPTRRNRWHTMGLDLFDDTVR